MNFKTIAFIKSLTNCAGGAQMFCLKNNEFLALALSKFATGLLTCFRANMLKYKCQYIKFCDHFQRKMIFYKP